MSTAYLQRIANQMGFLEQRIIWKEDSPGVSGEATLRGMVTPESGVSVKVAALGPELIVMFHTISHMEDETGGVNQYMNTDYYDEKVALILTTAATLLPN